MYVYISIWILPVGYKNIYVGKGNTYVCMFEHIPIKTQEVLQKKCCEKLLPQY